MAKQVTSTASPMFPSIIAGEQAIASEHQQRERLRRVTEHRHSMTVCWPAWDGNLSVGARIETRTCVCTLAADANPNGVPLTAGQGFYFYTAPCRIIEVVDAETFIAEIDYDKDSTCAHENGIKVKLDILDVWVPVRILTANRKGFAKLP